MTKKEALDILELNGNANDQEAQKAFRRLSQEYHPDKPSGDEDKFKQINEAYQVITKHIDPSELVALEVDRGLAKIIEQSTEVRQIDNLVISAKLRASSKIGNFQMLALGCAGLAGLIASQGDKIIALFGIHDLRIAVIITIVSAVYALHYNLYKQHVDKTLSESISYLDDVSDLADMLKPVIKQSIRSNRTRVTSKQFEELLVDTIHAPRVGSMFFRMEDLTHFIYPFAFIVFSVRRNSIRTILYWMGHRDGARLIILRAKAGGLISEIGGIPPQYQWTEEAILFANKVEY